MKFIAYRNLSTLISYYLDNINNIISIAVFLGLELRRDLIEDFFSISIRRNPDFQHDLIRRIAYKFYLLI